MIATYAGLEDRLVKRRPARVGQLLRHGRDVEGAEARGPRASRSRGEGDVQKSRRKKESHRRANGSEYPFITGLESTKGE